MAPVLGGQGQMPPTPDVNGAGPEGWPLSVSACTSPLFSHRAQYVFATTVACARVRENPRVGFSMAFHLRELRHI